MSLWAPCKCHRTAENSTQVTKFSKTWNYLMKSLQDGSIFEACFSFTARLIQALSLKASKSVHYHSSCVYDLQSTGVRKHKQAFENQEWSHVKPLNIRMKPVLTDF